ncbi:hypothetical protein BCT21_07215 [Vibrio sp. 10N.222.55.F9]|uniref:hypothetical protein n=1 Tax=Vibrio sp. 10N.222.55.F9 TaxID=1884471 RepID=UPI000C816A5C|nr:hypothetical protein [Vibrio sp. 10N.222.55.F9]PMO02814.1 hypothetical protein BCT21_07215 [Vibrio sp. 10N.222.55.F9]
MSDNKKGLTAVRLQNKIANLRKTSKEAALEQGILQPSVDGQIALDLMPSEPVITADYIKAKDPGCLKKEIDDCRTITSKLFYRENKPKPSLTSCSDGTGTGKSYGQLKAYIEETTIDGNAQGHRCLFFITPLKNQIDFDDKLMKTAQDKGIYFVPFLSRSDLYTMDFKNWLPDLNGIVETNKERYDRWFKIGYSLPSQYDDVKNSLRTLSDAIRSLVAAERKLKDPSLTDGERSATDKALMYERGTVVSILGQLSVICADVAPKSLSGLLGCDSKRERLLAEIILHTTPLEMAKVRPCVLVATTRKFDFKTSILSCREDGYHYRKSMPFTRLLGGKKMVNITEFGAYVSKPHEKQMEYLTESYLASDEKNIFRKRKISFDLVVDEEHESYGILMNSCTTNLLDNKATQMPDVLAGVHRILRQVEGYEADPTVPVACFEEKKAFVDLIKAAIKAHCDLSPKQDLRSLTGLFSNKVDHFLIRSTNVEQIVSLTKNVFSFRPKRFFNENGLRNIRVRPMYFDSTYEIYFTEDKADPSASLYDIYQVLLASLYGAASVKKNSKMLKQLREPSAHNETLARFIKKALDVRGEVTQMFDKTTDSDLEITSFFAFFLPKAVFSIEKCNDLEFFEKGDGTEDVTYVDFKLDIITELPEAGLTQFLYNTNNTVLMLSATSGINGVCNGQYDRNFLNTYSVSGLEKPDLGYTLITRKPDDIQPLAELRDTRNILRKVEFKEIPEEASALTPAEHSEEFKLVYRAWYERLSKKWVVKPDSTYEIKSANRGTYKEREFGRILSALLMAAYDKRNTLILSLSGDFFKEVRAYLKSQDTYPDGLKIIRPEGVKQPSILEFKPFKNGITLRVIMFDSALGQATDIRNQMYLGDENTKIAFVSHYRAAGTGLNYFVNHRGEIQEDFERLVLVNSPYWSQVHVKGGWNSLENYVTLLKHFAASNGTKRLSDFSTSLVTGENYKILNDEHCMELLKVIMQAIGRVERRDTKITTEIFMPEDVLRNAVMQFQRLGRDPRNEMFRESMSLLNYKWMKYCEATAAAASFSDDKERQQLEKKTKRQARQLDSFFNKTVPQLLEQARQGDNLSVRFNEALRHIDCVVDPVRYIDRLKNTDVVKNDLYLAKVLDVFFIDLGEGNEHVKLCRNESEPKILTDMQHGDYEYDPVLQLLGFTRTPGDSLDGLAASVLKAGQALEKGAFNGMIPHPSVLPLLKGNVGEYLVLTLLEELGITPLAIDEVIEQIGKRAYELFDMYVVVDSVLICIDAKNWTTATDKEDMSMTTHKKAVDKLGTVKGYVGERFDAIKGVYVNTRKEQNDAYYIFAEVSPGEELFYLNMFKDVIGYGPAKRYRKKLDGTKIPEEIGRLADTVCINEKLTELLSREEN